MERAYNNKEEFKELFETVRKDTGNRLKISCLSRTFQQGLMWSHYADKHSGICFGLDLGTNNYNFNNTVLAAAVKYNTFIETVNYFKDPNKAIFNWFLSKSAIWSYEEEIRLISLSNMEYLKFPKDCLKEIYFGVRTKPEEIKNIKELLIAKNCEVKILQQLKLSRDTFDLTIKD